MTGWLLKETWTVQQRAPLWIVSGKDHAADPGEADCARTHRAGFKRNVEVETGKPVIAQP